MANRRCVQCGHEFEVTAQDLEFYTRISPVVNGRQATIPPPSLCYPCRQQRRLTWRNERTLYWRNCDLTGRRIMSTYAPDSEFKVYNCEDWFSDKWDGLQYGREFDFNRPFFEQFSKLLHQVPVPAAFADSTSQNTEYANLSKRNKNCYFIFAATDCEECFYTTYLQRNRDVCDCFFIFDSELCYECIDCYNCYNLGYSQYCRNCRDSEFLLGCSGCSNCLCCVSLNNKKYHIFNKPYSAADYEREAAALRKDAVEKLRASLEFLAAKTPQKCYAGVNNENVSGDHISFSKNVQLCFDCTHLEDCKYCTWLHSCKDCYDHYAWGLSGELGYENHLVGEGFYNVRFCEQCFTTVSDLLYCRLCVNGCRNLFGCSGLQHKEYCILNRQYSQDDYNALLLKIAAHMERTKEWGEFFPQALSPYGYGETVAQEYFPLAEEEVLARGWKWRAAPPVSSGKETISWNEVPAAISKVSDDLAKEVLVCTKCLRNFRLTSGELRLYRRLNVPVPRACFSCRYEARRERRNPRALWQRPCAQCGTEMSTSFPPASSAVVYCEPCYLQHVY